MGNCIHVEFLKGKKKVESKTEVKKEIKQPKKQLKLLNGKDSMNFKK